MCEKKKNCFEGQKASGLVSKTQNTVCQDCDEGTFSTTILSLTCTNCSATQYQDKKGQTSCIEKDVCDLGEFVVDEGSITQNRVCNVCPEGKFGQNTCQDWSDCPAGTFISSPGNNTNDRQCQPCPQNTFSTDKNTYFCKPHSKVCVPSTYVAIPANATADKVCKECENGFSNITDQVQCHPYKVLCQGEFYTSIQKAACL